MAKNTNLELARICIRDTTGDYDTFLKKLSARLPRSPRPGDVFIVLHNDETKELYVERNPNKRYDIHVNPTTVKNMEEFVRNAPASAPGVKQHNEILMVLSGFSENKGHWVVWEDKKTCLVIPHPTTVKSQGSKERIKRMKRLQLAHT